MEELLGGRYRLDHVAGHGGMATVFVAWDSVLERAVAIKLLHRGRDEGGVLHERFRREALTEARVVHPNVVAVHDVGLHADGRPYIVMDYVEGRPLSAILAERVLSSEEAALVGVQLARALAAAHALGIVHRDVKPANVLIDAQGSAHLTDFGLAWAGDAAEARLTAPGALIGSAAYVAPEQARSGEVSPLVDLYALGGLLYHALAGAPPFEGGGALAVALRRFDEDPPALPVRAPEVDLELAGLVQVLLARAPEARPQSAVEVAEQLGDIAARLRLQRTGGEAGGPPAAIVVAGAGAALGTAAGPAPAVPMPNRSLLPPGDVDPNPRGH
ncbi:MAG TPA: serine/threonine-protein kinase [Candidatus Sulfotelmatobacter sp.]|nr:serine/threonine-protein kinase [Candidatus Sulfotelmatobacter sp.]